MRANTPQLPGGGGGGWAQLELTGALIILVYGKEIDKRKRSIIKINFSFSAITVEKPGSLILYHPNYIISQV